MRLRMGSWTGYLGACLIGVSFSLSPGFVLTLLAFLSSSDRTMGHVLFETGRKWTNWQPWIPATAEPSVGGRVIVIDVSRYEASNFCFFWSQKVRKGYDKRMYLCMTMNSSYVASLLFRLCCIATLSLFTVSFSLISSRLVSSSDPRFRPSLS
jgi:hypothetical protein